MSVLVVMERNGGKWRPTAWEALAAGIQTGAETGQPVAAAVVGDDVSAAAAEVAGKAIETVHALEHELLGAYTADGWTAALGELIQDLNAEYVVFLHTYQVRDYGPKLATRFRRVMVSDVVRMRFGEDGLTLTRQIFQGKLLADIRVGGEGPVFFSVQAGAWRADSVEAGAASVVARTPSLGSDLIRSRPEAPFQEAEGEVDLTAAQAIVTAGRGIREEADISLIQKLAEQLGAEVAASRPVCDNGWLPIERQVGSSGQTVAPKLYVAVGVSGAIQHLVGMKGSQTIVAINKDPEAPIFEVADYGIAGDLYDVVPALIEELRRAKA